MSPENAVMQEVQQDVTHFRTEAQQPYDARRGVTLVVEEAEELLEAINEFASDETQDNMEALLKEMGDLIYVSVGLSEQLAAGGVSEGFPIIALIPEEHRGMVQQALQLFDMAYNDFLDVDDFRTIMQTIHMSNMSKIHPDAPRDESGKVLKDSPYYVKADLSDVASRSLERIRQKRQEADEYLQTVPGYEEV